VTNNPEGLAQHTLLRDGVAADGATQVVLRHKVVGPGQVQFEVDDPDGGPTTPDAVGSLSSLGGQEQQLVLTVDAVLTVTGDYMALAVYHAPADFVSNPGAHMSQGCRRVRVRAEFTPPTGANVQGTTLATRHIEVVRPPVVLVHGLWSYPSTWGEPEQSFLTDPNFVVKVADYRGTRASGFLTNKRVTWKAIRDAVSTLRQDNYATTRADVIGHSMGGVLARMYAQSFGGVTYRRNENFNQGDIHKLVTIDSPHKGSPLASVLMGAPQLRQTFGLRGNDCNAGAVADLVPNSPPNVLANAQPTDVYAHAIVALQRYFCSSSAASRTEMTFGRGASEGGRLHGCDNGS
jgi:pimeloyl-ACP methyl ester carboxylesterase